MPFIGKLPDVGAFRLIDSITTSATDTYALQVEGLSYFPSSARNLIVSLNGVTQAPESAYTVSGSNIVFDSALTASDVIDYILVIGESVDIGTPSDNTVGNAQLKSDLDFSGKTLTFSADQISGDAINGGTISNFASTGIDDNATSTAITIDSSNNVTFGADAQIDSNLGVNTAPNANYSIFGLQNGSLTNAGYLQANGTTGIALTALGTAGSQSSNTVVIQTTGSSATGHSLNIDHTGTGSAIHVQSANGSKAEINLAQTAVTNFRISVPASTDALTFVYGASTERMRLDASGNLGINTLSPTTKLHVQNSAVSPSWSAYAGTTLTLEDASNQGTILQFVSPSSYTGEVWFGDGDSRNSGRIRYEHNLDKMEFWTSGTERFSVESDGALHAKSSNTGTNPAANAHIASELRFFNTSATDNNLNAIGFYNSNELIDARIAAVHKSHSARQGELSFMTHSGSALEERLRIESNGNTAIKANGGEIRFTGHSIYRAGGFGSGLHFTTNAVIPVNENGSVSDNTESLGTSTYRWKDLYLSGGAYVGGTGSANYLDDYEEGTFTLTLYLTYGGSPNFTNSIAGRYVKIGKIVHCEFQGQLNGSNAISVDDRFRLDGLPFGEQVNQAAQGGASIHDSYGGGHSSFWNTRVTGADLLMWCHHEDGAVDYGDEIIGSITYETS